MMRITILEQAGALKLQVEGKLVGLWVAELERCWEQTLLGRPASTIRVDVGEVTHVDAAGKDLLATMHGQGADLVAAGCLMKAVVAEVTCQQRFPLSVTESEPLAGGELHGTAEGHRNTLRTNQK